MTKNIISWLLGFLTGILSLLAYSAYQITKNHHKHLLKYDDQMKEGEDDVGK